MRFVTLLGLLLTLAKSEQQVDDEGPCWFMMFLHVAKTGGTIDIDSLGVGLTTKKFHIMTKTELVQMTMDPLPDPSLPLYRRTVVEIHGHVHHDGCLQAHWTVPWGRKVADKFEKAGCRSVIWTLLREPIAHYISWYRWNYMGFRQIEFAKKVGGILRPKRSSMKDWALSVLAKSRDMSPKIDSEDIEFLESADKLANKLEDLANGGGTWWPSSNYDKYLIFAVMLSEPTQYLRFQSTRLTPQYNYGNSEYISNFTEYDPVALCGNRTSWETPEFALKYLKAFDIIGLTELRAAVLARVALKVTGSDGPTIAQALYSRDCKSHDNPARDVLTSQESSAAGRQQKSTSAESEHTGNIWSKENLPSILTKILETLLANEVEFYKLVRDEHWCKLDGIRGTVSRVLSTCDHPWDFETYKCPQA